MSKGFLFTEELAQVKRLKVGMNYFTQQAVSKNKEWLLDKNREQLMDKGEDSQGKEVVPLYALETVKYKQESYSEDRWVTLYDTGAFHESFTLTAYIDRFEISATDHKKFDLQKKYDQGGVQILGVQEKELAEFTRRFVVPELRNFAKRIFKI